MKKLLSVLVLGAFTALIACGPSAEELAKKAQATKDSLEKVQKTADSIAAIAKIKEDSLAAAQKVADSIAAAEAAKKGKPTVKPIVKPTKPNQVNPNTKAGQGKG
jgi:hypothetical protein